MNQAEDHTEHKPRELTTNEKIMEPILMLFCIGVIGGFFAWIVFLA